MIFGHSAIALLIDYSKFYVHRETEKFVWIALLRYLLCCGSQEPHPQHVWGRCTLESQPGSQGSRTAACSTGLWVIAILFCSLILLGEQRFHLSQVMSLLPGRGWWEGPGMHTGAVLYAHDVIWTVGICWEVHCSSGPWLSVHSGC